MTLRSSYTTDEWETLKYTPLVVFYSVAWADGSISRLETASLMSIVDNVAKGGPRSEYASAPELQLLMEVLAEVKRDLDTLLARLDAQLGQGLTFEGVLQRARAVLDRKTPPVPANGFKRGMMVLAVQIAEAAPLIGKKVTDQERTAVERIRASLGA
jgi:hypothetical protein